VFGGGTLTSNYSSKITDDILRVGVNYRFGGGPVVAKYDRAPTRRSFREAESSGFSGAFLLPIMWQRRAFARFGTASWAAG